MTPEQVFSAANLAAALAWLALIALPRVDWIPRLITGLIVPAVFAAIYVVLLVAHWGSGGFSSLAAVAQLFSNPWLLLAGWIHYLAFDLFVGTWEARDARRHAVPHLLLIPCLVLTFLFGPAGWLLYQVVRRAAGRRQWRGDANSTRAGRRGNRSPRTAVLP